MRCIRIGRLFVALLVLGTAANRAAAQSAPQPYKQVVSANPFGLLLDFYNGEYERVVGESSTIGIGGSGLSNEEDKYINADVFWRYYPRGVPLDGWAFGAKVGVTNIPDVATRFGYGFDVNRSWLMGKKNNFYVGIGFGLKRLIGAKGSDEFTNDGYVFDPKYIPTFRIVNIGFAF